MAKTRTAERVTNGLLYGYLVAAVAFVLLPVAILILFSFSAARYTRFPIKAYSFKWYEQLFANDALIDALIRSAVLGVLCGLTTTLLGFLAAYCLARYEFPFKAAFHTFLILPVTVSYTIIGLGLLIFFTQIGLAGSFVAVWIAHTALFLPIPVAIIYSQLTRYQMNLERAAKDLGASTPSTLIYITLPLIAPAALASFFLTFTLSWDEFIVAFFLGGFEVTLPVKILLMIRSGLHPTINAVGALVFIVSMGAAVLAFTFFRRSRL